MNDIRRDAPSFHRNIEPITQKMHEILSKNSLHVLEIGSGSGQHTTRLSREFPHLNFQPTEYDVDNLPSINSWCEGYHNVEPAVQLDVSKKQWFEDEATKFDILLCFNVIHITPWKITEAIFKGAKNVMSNECQLLFYGPFKIDGKQTSDSNGEFEKWLKGKDQGFGIRDISEVDTVAKNHGFKLKRRHPMPANNLICEFARV